MPTAPAFATDGISQLPMMPIAAMYGSIVAAGLDPDALPVPERVDLAHVTNPHTEEASQAPVAKAWKDIWSAGQSVAGIDSVVPVAELVDQSTATPTDRRDADDPGASAADRSLVLLRSGDEALLRLLDERLWTYSDDAFLPHGLAGGVHDAAQPVLLTSDTDVPNDARACVLLDAMLPDDCTRFERVLLLFDGANAGATAAARTAWRQAAALADTSRSYHTQSPGGGWVTSG